MLSKRIKISLAIVLIACGMAFSFNTVNAQTVYTNGDYGVETDASFQKHGNSASATRFSRQKLVVECIAADTGAVINTKEFVEKGYYNATDYAVFDISEAVPSQINYGGTTYEQMGDVLTTLRMSWRNKKGVAHHKVYYYRSNDNSSEQINDDRRTVTIPDGVVFTNENFGVETDASMQNRGDTETRYYNQEVDIDGYDYLSGKQLFRYSAFKNGQIPADYQTNTGLAPYYDPSSDTCGDIVIDQWPLHYGNYQITSPGPQPYYLQMQLGYAHDHISYWDTNLGNWRDYVIKDADSNNAIYSKNRSDVNSQSSSSRTSNNSDTSNAASSKKAKDDKKSGTSSEKYLSSSPTSSSNVAESKSVKDKAEINRPVIVIAGGTVLLVIIIVFALVRKRR